MKTKRTLIIAVIIAATATFAAGGIFSAAEPVQAKVDATSPILVDPPPTPCLDGLECYRVMPSDTDGNDENYPGDDCPDTGIATGIGCENRWGEDAINTDHYLYLPPSLTNTGKLLVFLGGGEGNAGGGKNIYPVAARQGYHVIGLAYPAAGANSPCAKDSLNAQEKLDCFGNAFREVVTGEDAGSAPGGDVTAVSEHRQDSIVNRLVRVIEWAHANHPTHGWNRYLTDGGVDWSQVHLAGASNGSSHVGFMGTLNQFRNVGRVALFIGPDDGAGGTTEETWIPATYIQQTEVPTGTRYYGLVHVLNKAVKLSDGEPVFPEPLYQVTKNWLTFGMEGPLNRERFCFDPDPNITAMDFGGAHMLISTDLGTIAKDAHNSVIEGRYCSHYAPDLPDHPTVYKCDEWEGELIGYTPAWRCVLGTGDAYASSTPEADAGSNQNLECQGNGGAMVVLDGSGSKDVDCDALTYTWTGPFGHATGRKPTVFLPVGTSVVTLVVSDGWWSSAPDTTLITVTDTQPPSLQVTLSATTLWPANHRLVRINATVSAADSCGGPLPQVVLTSITSNQPDNGSGDGNTQADIREGAFGTFDTSFLLRAERAGGDPLGRTYTVTYTATDASGNSTQASATVRVPHSP